MTATIHPLFPRAACDARETARTASPRSGAGHPFPEAMEALAADHVMWLQVETLYGEIADLIDLAAAARRAGPREPSAVAADLAHDSLTILLMEMDALFARLGRTAAMAEARRIDAELSELSAADALNEWRHLRASQREAVLWVQGAEGAGQ
jgi:hypothetical protein